MSISFNLVMDTPLQEEILDIALSKIKTNPNHMSMNFHDSSPVIYNLKDDFVVNEYKDLIARYEYNLDGGIEIIDYTRVNDKEIEAVLEEDILSFEINELLNDDGLYVISMQEMIWK
ncbi:hypothetical protein [Clostridium sp. DJ247]|uniref:hypothetical protein n=1 Tax=Clostridium sp. DJ247 TaxID=2726188 RepID=UPI00162A17EC|nr:hypothetical protein [Clostridium sp. DJ247]MBC2580166.1 hypothetical protein [Clostridium sp. DJ247]